MKNIFRFINFYILTLWGFVMVTPSFAAPKLFWSDWGNNKIQSANIDGTGVQDLVTGLSSAKGNVAIDTENNKVFWIDRGTGFLQKANLDGSNVEIFTSEPGQRMWLGLEWAQLKRWSLKWSLPNGGGQPKNLREAGRFLPGWVHSALTKRVGCTMHAWDGSMQMKVRSRVYGFGKNRMVGCGQSKASGPTCGPIIPPTGSISTLVAVPGFTTFQRSPTNECIPPNQFCLSQSLVGQCLHLLNLAHAHSVFCSILKI